MSGPRYPGYDVLAKRDSPSWNQASREAIDARLTPPPRRFLDAGQFALLQAVCARIMPQPDAGTDSVPIAAMIDARLHEDHGDGYRIEGMPRFREAWPHGLRAIAAEAVARHGRSFPDLAPAEQDALLACVQAGEVQAAEWQGLHARHFFTARLLHDVVSAYYAHPRAWNEIGFGGPAAPRGYVRLEANRRDPWEARAGMAGEAGQ